MNTTDSLTRRRFIRNAVATGTFIAAPQIVPSSVLGREGHTHLPAGIAYEDVVIVEKGHPATLDEPQQARLLEIMHQPEIELRVALNGPGEEATVYFSDLTHDYVTLNAEYST